MTKKRAEGNRSQIGPPVIAFAQPPSARSRPVDEEADPSDMPDTAEEAATLDDHETAYGISAE